MAAETVIAVALLAPLPVLAAVSWTAMRIPLAALKTTRCKCRFIALSLPQVVMPQLHL